MKETDRLQSLMNRLLTPSRLPRVEAINVHEVTERVRMLLLAEFPEDLAVARIPDPQGLGGSLGMRAFADSTAEGEGRDRAL